jgi:hypothetical protein
MGPRLDAWLRIRTRMKSILLIFCFIFLAACGKEINDKSSSELSSALDSNECKLTGEDYSGCCSSHGGALKCGQMSYKFSIANRLICNDKTISPSCIYK